MAYSAISAKRLAIAAMLAGAVPGVATAQECSNLSGSLGLSVVCVNCSISKTVNGDSARFSTEPEITDVDRGTPAAEWLRSGDMVVSIDGHLITTTVGGFRFSSVRPGQPITLVVRRHGELITARFNAVQRPCSRQETIAGSASTSPAPPVGSARGQAAVTGNTAPTYAPRAAFGFAISCSDCSQQPVNQHDPAAGVVWKFNQQPEVYSVEPGSAADRAGLRRGDVLTAIDAIEITAPEAGRKFGTIRPGQPMRFTYRRGNAMLSVVVTAQPPTLVRHNLPGSMTVGAAAAGAGDAVTTGQARTSGGFQPIRYSGRLGNTDIEVRGGVGVTVRYTDDEIIITSGETTVRLWRR